MFAIQAVSIDGMALRQQLENPAAGAVVVFEGLVRNHNEGHAVGALEYECFESLALAEATRIYAEAQARFEVFEIVCVHRTGLLQIGEMAVWTGVNAAHRDAAFEACRYVIDQIKFRLPIWKKEHYLNGQSEWVNCQRCASHEHQLPELARKHPQPNQDYASQKGNPV